VGVLSYATRNRWEKKVIGKKGSKAAEPKIDRNIQTPDHVINNQTEENEINIHSAKGRVPLTGKKLLKKERELRNENVTERGSKEQSFSPSHIPFYQDGKKEGGEGCQSRR